jgi:glycerophosphoryl diester phosphodiesterase
VRAGAALVVADHGFVAADFPAIVAHRGASSTHPENTLPSFAAALDLGAPIVELDVRRSADGVAVVMHDPSVERTTDGAGFVHELTADTLARLNAGSPEHPAGVPTLAEVLQLVSGRGAVALEIKNIPGEPAYDPDGEPIVEAALEGVERARFVGGVLVLSFNPRSIAAAKGIAPQIPTGFLTNELVPPGDALAHVVEKGHDLVLPGTRSLLPLGEPFVRAAHDAGVRVGTWTADDPETVRMLLRWGVDAIASNDPAMALGVLAELA